MEAVFWGTTVVCLPFLFLVWVLSLKFRSDSRSKRRFDDEREEADFETRLKSLEKEVASVQRRLGENGG